MRNRLLGISLILAFIVCSGLLIYQFFFRKEVVYVDIGKLVEGYQLKKDLEKKAEVDLLRIKNVIDSLKLVRKLSGDPSVDSNIARLGYQFGQYYEQSNSQISTQVWERLNPAIEAFGKANDYKLIVGANGAGTVLYGDSERDITDELIVFINNKYEKGN